ncbi:MAG: undecaprenyl-diphosphate phosphatase [Kiritimatiellia bacterium]|nr:undecaprenyl-diphosphate phosphatase [Kiritimatiellia bacterium]
MASIPCAVISKLFEEYAENTFRNPILIAATVGGFGLILLIADRWGPRQKKTGRNPMVGCVANRLQSGLGGVIPGISRSGSTIAAGLGLGFPREEAARFSFLMSMPIIFGAGLVKIRYLSGEADLAALAVGFLASAVFGFLSIRYLLRYVSKHDFKIFVWYRFALAVVILIFFSYTGKIRFY